MLEQDDEERAPRVTVHAGDCVAVLEANYPDEFFPVVVCDPPYGIEFMGAGWDHGVPSSDVWRAIGRKMKPGAYLVAFGAPRVYHRLAVAIEDAGFEIRDCLSWLYGSGWPKGIDVAKGIDKQRHDRAEVLEVTAWIRETRDARGVSNKTIDGAFGFAGMAGHWTAADSQPAVPTLEQWPTLLVALGCTPDDVPERIRYLAEELNGRKGEFGAVWHAREITGTVEEWTDRVNYAITSRDGLRRDKPASDAAKRWQGWHTALKPAWEPIVLARKPMPSTVAQNVLEYGTGALNIDACRIAGDVPRTTQGLNTSRTSWDPRKEAREFVPNGGGRWPANLILDDVAAAMLDEFTGERRPGSPVRGTEPSAASAGLVTNARDRIDGPSYGDAGGASRFFYTAKASRAERDAGLLGEARSDDTGPANYHPTVKPIDVMRWLVRLTTPGRGPVLDPFAGSGTTGCAAALEWCDSVLIDKDPGHAELCAARGAHWIDEAIAERKAYQAPLGAESLAPAPRPAAAPIVALDLFDGFDQ